MTDEQREQQVQAIDRAIMEIDSVLDAYGAELNYRMISSIYTVKEQLGHIRWLVKPLGCYS